MAARSTITRLTAPARSLLASAAMLVLGTGWPAATLAEETDSLTEGRKRRDTWSVQAGATASYMIHAGPDIQRVLHSYWASHYDIRVKWRQAKANTWPYDRALNRPTIQAGLTMGDFSRVKVYRDESAQRSTIGRMWTLYGGTQLEVAAGRRWSFGADLQNGLSWCTDPYNEHDNADNEIIGSRVSLYVNLGLYARYRLARQWHVALGIDFKHYSNGSMDRPNIGINTIGPTLAMQYDMQATADDHGEEPPRAEEEPFRKKVYTDVVAGLGLKALIDGFNVNHSSHNPVYGFPMVIVAPMLRHHLVHATGIGIDYSYADYVYKIREYDRIREVENDEYSPHIVGLSLRHEVFYRHFSVNVGLGYNILKKTGHTADENESKLYQHVSARFSLPFTRDRIYVGYNVKAYKFQKVDCLQLIAGCRLGW